MLDGWTEPQARALLGAMADVGNRGSGSAATLVEAAASRLFDLDGGAPDPTSPEDLAGALDTDEQRFLAIQLLVLVPYADTVIDEPEVDRVDDFAAALGVDPQTLEDLHKVRKGHIRRLLVDYGRRAASSVQVPGESRGVLRRTIAEVHQYLGDAKVTEQYLPLAGYPAGSLGRTFFDFYRARGFALPGEKHSLGTEVVSHDCCHILAGFNTDGAGEIDVAGFEAGMKRDEFGFELMMEVLLDFQLGIDFGVGLVGYVPKTGEFDPDQAMLGIRRGLACSVDIMGPDWDFWAVADRPVVDLRAEYGITGVDEVLLPPPDHPATDG